MSTAGGAFYHSNVSLDKAKNIVKGSFKALSMAGSTEHRFRQECETPILDADRARVRGWTPLLIVTSVVTLLGSSIPVGYNIGVMNNPAEVIKGFCSKAIASTYGSDLSPSQLNILWSSIISIFIVGGVIGSLIGGWVADLTGRKGALMVNHVVMLIPAVLFVTCRLADSVEMLLLARLIVGLASGLVTGIVPMYLTEISPICIRGAMGVITPLGLTLGVLLGQIMGLRSILGNDDAWHYLLGFYAILVLLASIPLPFLPESPKFLYAVKGQTDRAIDELCRLREVSSPEELGSELEELCSQSLTENADSAWSVKNVLSLPELHLPLALVCALQAGQQFSGINAVFFYSGLIFESAGIKENQSQYATIGAGAVNILVAILSMFLLNKFGRRPLALLSCWLSVACLILLTISIALIDTVSWMSYISIFAVLAYIFNYGFGLGPIPYFIGSELFEVGPRPVAMAFGSMSNWGGNFVVGMTFPSLQEVIGPYSFLIFAFFTICLAEFVRWYLPETKGRTPEEVQESLKGGFRRRRGAIFVAPTAQDSDVGNESTGEAI